MPHLMKRGLSCLIGFCVACGGDDGSGPSAGLIVAPETLDLQDCEVGQISAILLDDNGNPVQNATITFTSTDPAVASVSGGVVTAQSAGSARIVITSGRFADTVLVTVTGAPNTLSFAADSIDVFEGIARQLVPTYSSCHGTPAGGSITYQSSNPQVATYVNGTLTALSSGVTILSATDGTLSDSLDLVVKDTPVLVGTVPLSSRPFGMAASTTRAFATRLDAAAVSATTFPSTAFTDVVAVGNTPTDVAFHPSGQKAYVTNQLSQTVGVIDVATDTQVDTIQVPGSPFRALFNSTGDRAFVTTNAGNVHVIDAATDSIIATVSVGFAPNGLALSQDNALLYVSDMTGNIHVVNTATSLPVDTLAVSGKLQDMGMSEDGLSLFVADEFGWLKVVNLGTGSVADSVPVGGFGLKLSPAKDLIYLASGGSVTMIDARSLEIVKPINVGGSARRIAVLPDGSMAFVANESGYISILQ